MVSVDDNKLKQAFGTTINQNEISAKTKEYINQISADIKVDLSSIKDDLSKRFRSLSDGLKKSIQDQGGAFKKSEIESIVKTFIKKQNFKDLEGKYFLPADKFADMYQGLLSGLLNAYVSAYGLAMQMMGQPFDPETDSVVIQDEIYNQVLETYLSSTQIDAVFEAVAIPVNEIQMKQAILTKVGDLTSYLSSTFSKAFKVDQDAIIGAFKLNFSEEELSRVVTAMFTKKKTTLATNLSALGYQDLKDPTRMSFYFWSFDGKTHFLDFLNNYNDQMKTLGDDEKVIDYTDTTGVLMSSVKTIVDAVSYVLIAFVSISLVVSSIMIGVITYISVYERTKEIGILRAIGASKHNISSIFNAETFIIGLLSGLIGIGISYLLIPIINLVLHHFTGDIPLSATLDIKTALFLIVLSVVLTLIAGIIPSRSASKKDPVEALRSE